ncbi:hypothetical protein RYX36_033028 [Vicia faba]
MRIIGSGYNHPLPLASIHSLEPLSLNQIAHLNADHANPYAKEIGIRTNEKEACSSWS